MPHIIVKLWKGRSEEIKERLAEDISKVVSESLKTDISNVSVGIEEYSPNEWEDKVVKEDILGKKDTIYVLPGNLK